MDKREEFLKNFPYNILEFDRNEINIDVFSRANFTFNFKKFKVCLRFSKKIFNEDILNQLAEQIKRDYYLIKMTITEYDVVDYRFSIRKLENLYDVIEMIDSYFLILEMGKE